MLRSAIFIFCAAGLLYGLFRQTAPPMLFSQSDKFGHLAGFATMTIIAIWTLPRKYVPIFFIVILILAFSAEFLQEWLLPQRRFSFNDMYANLAGIGIIFVPWLAWLISQHFLGAKASDTDSINLQPSENQQ